MNAEPNPPSARPKDLDPKKGSAPSSEPEQVLFPVLNDYWEALRRGGDTDPELWLHTRADGPEGLPELHIVAALHDVRQLLIEDSNLEGPNQERAPDEGVGQRRFLEPSTRLGECRIEALLGCGGMGEVYLAEHEALGRQVAVKVLPERLADNPEAVQRFRKSVQLLARLNPHPHIAHALHASQHEGRFYLVMEYVPGIDLKSQVRQSGPLPPAQACDLIRQAAVGLAYAHEHGIIHRDIKPSNLMLTPEGKVKVLDLGLARLAFSEGSTLDVSQTNPDTLVGTLDYIAPEQARDARRADRRSDLYSLGCTFYFLLAGRPPFEHRAHLEKLLAHALEEPEDVRQLCADVPAPVAEVVHKLLAKKPEERYSSAHTLIAELDAASGLKHGADSTNRTSRVRGRRKWSATLAAALVTAALGVALFWSISSRQDPSVAGRGTQVTTKTPALARLGLMVQVEDGRSVPYRLVSNGAELDFGQINPLAREHELRMEGEFEQPTHWYLLWFDTAGSATLAARSPDMRREIVFPPDEDGHMRYVPASGTDPPGVHLLLLAAGAELTEPEEKQLVARVANLGPPPFKELPLWTHLLRGPGETRPAAGPVPNDYLKKIRNQLPAGVVDVYPLFVKTVR